MCVEGPKVSVVFPVFNGARFVVEAMRSVLNQTPALEVVVHDDGSVDETYEIVAALAHDDPRIDLSRGPNAGPAAARNTCLSRIRGDLVAFMDHDDIWPAGRLAHQLEILQRKDAAAGVIGETFIFDSLNAEGQPRTSPKSRRVLAGLLQAGLFRRSALAQIGRFDTSLRAADDLDLLLRLVEAGFRLHVDNEIAVYYRLHAEQWTGDLAQTSAQTVRALGKSLARRRQEAGADRLEWRLNDD